MGFGRGQSQSGYSRCIDNLGLEAEDVPTMKLLVKTHKPVSAAGHPQSCPVVAAATGLSSRAGDALADILQPMIVADLLRMEDMSTEEVITQLEEAERTMKDSGLTNTMVGSLDVKALYPSLDHMGAAEAVEKFVYNSKVEMCSVDYRAAQVFMASNLMEDEVMKEGLVHLVPRRTKVMGPRPGRTTTELSRKQKEAGQHDEASKWRHTDVETLTFKQKKLIISKVCKVATLNIFANHMYQFGGVTFCQLVGAPIGLRLTSIVARIVMDQWVQRFLVLVTDAGAKVHFLAKYVNDINIIVAMFGLGMKWVDSGLVHTVELEEQDRLESRTRER